MEHMDYSLMGIITLAGAVVGLFMQLLSLNAKIRKQAAEEQKLIDSVDILKDHACESRANHSKIEAHLARIETSIHQLELSNERQHHEVSERVRALEVLIEENKK